MNLAMSLHRAIIRQGTSIIDKQEVDERLGVDVGKRLIIIDEGDPNAPASVVDAVVWQAAVLHGSHGPVEE